MTNSVVQREERLVLSLVLDEARSRHKVPAARFPVTVLLAILFILNRRWAHLREAEAETRAFERTSLKLICALKVAVVILEVSFLD